MLELLALAAQAVQILCFLQSLLLAVVAVVVMTEL
jgi:hypothetical protein